VVPVRRVRNHIQVATPQLEFSIVNAGGDAVKIGEERFHPTPAARFESRFTHPKYLLYTGELCAELGNTGLAHAVVAEDEQGCEDAVVPGLRRVAQLLVQEGDG
jgi:hypothetical protein